MSEETTQLGNNAVAHLRNIAARAIAVTRDIEAMSAERTEIMKEAKAFGLDVKALKAAIKIVENDMREEVDEFETIREMYVSALDGISAEVGAVAASED